MARKSIVQKAHEELLQNPKYVQKLKILDIIKKKYDKAYNSKDNQKIEHYDKYYKKVMKIIVA